MILSSAPAAQVTTIAAWALGLPSLVALAGYAVAAALREPAGAALRAALFVGWIAHALAIFSDIAGVGSDSVIARFGFAPALSMMIWLVLAVYLVDVLIAVPLLGNLLPEKVSFLLSMRYYAGNWPASVWLFRGDSYRKLDRGLRKTSPWVYDQLSRFYDRRTAVGLVGKVMAFRLMHLHGRALGPLVRRAIDRPLGEYEWVDGELVCGLALGWNFGDGHLHDERLLASLQAQCGFEAGELRCIFIESQPLGRARLHWRIADAKLGVLEEGHVSVRELLARQPWDEQ